MRIQGTKALICAIFTMIVLACSIARGSEPSDEKSLSQFLAGTYSVVGKKPGSNKTYQGAITIVQSRSGLNILRCIEGKRSTGSAEIVGLTADKINVLRYSYKEGGSAYEGRYDIHSDLNNYGRLSGPYGQKGSGMAPGWELLYVDENSPVSCR